MRNTLPLRIFVCKSCRSLLAKFLLFSKTINLQSSGNFDRICFVIIPVPAPSSTIVIPGETFRGSNILRLKADVLGSNEPCVFQFFRASLTKVRDIVVHIARGIRIRCARQEFLPRLSLTTRSFGLGTASPPRLLARYGSGVRILIRNVRRHIARGIRIRCARQDSNLGPRQYQWRALPTELRAHLRREIFCSENRES